MSPTRTDLDALVSTGVISTQQRDQILGYTSTQATQRSTSRFVQMFGAFGAIVTGLGVMLLVASNWQYLSDAVRTILLISTTICTYIAGYRLAYHSAYVRTGQACMLLGSIMYGASIMLLGQIYNLGGTFPQALLVWAVGVLAVAYSTGFGSIFFLGIALLYGYILAQILDYDVAYSIFDIANLGICLGFLSLVLVRFHRGMYPSFSGILSFTGGVSVLFPLFAYTFTDFWSNASYMNRYGEDSISHVFLYLNIALVVCAVVALCISMWRNADIRSDTDVPFLVALVPIALVLAMTYQGEFPSVADMNYYGYSRRDIYTTYMTQVLVMNIVYICTILGMLWAGMKNHNKGILNVSIFFLAIYIFGKYVAFAFESRMSGALVFIAGGLLCIFGTILIEKIRRKLVGTMDTTVGIDTGAVHTEDTKDEPSNAMYYIIGGIVLVCMLGAVGYMFLLRSIF